MALVTVSSTSGALDGDFCRKLEAGDILYFPETPTRLAEDDVRFLLSQRQSGAGYHKNIAYRPSTDVVTGVAGDADGNRLKKILRSFSEQTVGLLARLMPQYAAAWRVDFASFRPLEEAGRKLSLHARNDLLHVDAFPSRPTHGDRILRFFTNLNPSQPRVWTTTDPFHIVAERLAGEARLGELAGRAASPARRALARAAGGLGLKQLAASPYDVLMHRFHNFMKENRTFQEACRKERVEFPPHSSWIVFTDSVSHAVLSGQYALEQTFVISRRAMVAPECAPLGVLERLTGRKLT